MPYSQRPKHQRTNPWDQYLEGVRMSDWDSFGRAILSMGAEIANADDMDAVLRSLKWDSRIKEPDRLTRKHLRLAMALIQMGRVDQMHREAE